MGVGQIVDGRYEILRQMAKNNFVTIYLAQDNNSEKVVLKMLNPPNIQKPGLVKKFKEGADIATKIEHPNLVSVFEIGEENQIPFVVMEYISGETLRVRLKTSSFSLSQALHIISCVGDALSYLHHREPTALIHGDVRPDNILLNVDQDNIRPVLLHFGVTQLLSLMENSKSSSTKDPQEQLIYIGPEQQGGKDLCPATDIYALAVTFFEILTRWQSHKLSPLPPLSNHVHSSLVGPFFDRILIKATAKEVGERYQDVIDFVKALKIAYTQNEQYKVDQEIGRGGFGIVYRAKDQKNNRDVALKVLTPTEKSNIELIKRFKQEVRTVVGLKHPNIIDIYDTGGPDDETFCLVMRLAPTTLRDRLAKGPLLRRDAMSIIKQVGAALTYAHNQTSPLIHRDVKPENILLDENQGVIKAVLTDFGLVKSLWSEDDLRTRFMLTTEHPGGTPPYMAPEQFDTEQLPTPAADVHALAVTFFEMIAGRRPSSRLPYIDSEPTLPSLSILTSNKTGPFFDQVLLKATAKDASKRFQSVSEFIAELEKANGSAEKNERLFEAVQGNLESCSYNPEEVLMVLNAVLNSHPNRVDALKLKGTIYLKQDQFLQAIEAYKKAYEYDQSFEVLQAYLSVLIKVAQVNWEKERQCAIDYYEQILNISDKDTAIEEIQHIRQQAIDRLVEYNNYLIISDSELIIEQIKSSDDAETLFEHYAKIDTAYQNLISLKPEKQWQKQRQERLEEQVKLREKLAFKAEKRADYATAVHHYEQTISHYKTISKLLEIDYTGNQEFNTNLNNKIKELERKVEQHHKYTQIHNQITNKEFSVALEQLIEAFISEGHYEYRDVLTMLIELAYAVKHKRLPRRWEDAIPRQPKKEIVKQNLERVFAHHATVILVILIIITSMILGGGITILLFFIR